MKNLLVDFRKDVIVQILDSLGEATMLLDTNEKSIVYYNKKFKKLFNLQKDLLLKGGIDYIKEFFSRSLLNPEPILFRSTTWFSNKEEFCDEFLFKDGRCFDITVKPLEINGVECLLCSFIEKTQEKLYKTYLKEYNNMFGKLIDNIPDIILLHKNFKCIYINSTGVRLLGYDNHKDIQGMDIRSFLVGDAIEELRTVFQDMQNGINYSNPVELEIADKDKNLHWIELISITKFLDDQGIYLSILRDITKEKQTNQKELLVKERESALVIKRDRYKLKYNFFTTMSHEAKTPINIVLAAAHMLKKEIKEDSTKGKEYIELINKNCNKIIRDINNFIDIERIQSGLFTTNFEVCDIIKIIEDITLSFIPYADEKNIELIFDAEIEEKTAKIDIYLLERVLFNLLSNAVKFTKVDGKIYVSVKDLGSEIEISIKDTGIGISQENLLLIFQRFRQAHRPDCSNERGSGLGLYLVKNILRIMGGKIFISSTEGVGSTFTISIPSLPI